MSRGAAFRACAFLCTLLLSLLCVWGCRGQQASPTARPLPTPDDRAIYEMMAAKYTSWDVILSVYEMSAAESARILGALEAMQPPVDMAALHEQAIRAYEYISAGKQVLPSLDGQVRAEAYFMIDWGIALLRDYRAQLDAVPPQDAQ